MRIVGFGQEEPKQEEKQQRGTVITEPSPVRSLVSVSFEEGGRTLTYYNDRFDLNIGDRVFVSGKLSGKVGYVESVTTKFRIRLSDYEKVLSVAQTPVLGTYENKGDMMCSYDADTVSPEDFRKWVLPPKDEAEDEEIIFGDGYEISMDDPTSADGYDPSVMQRAVKYCQEGKIGYVSVRNGVGKAFVHGTKWYEIDFRLSGNVLREAYCDCPYPGLCKHLLAVIVLLSVMRMHRGLDLARDFTMIGSETFWNAVRHTGQTITVHPDH